METDNRSLTEIDAHFLSKILLHSMLFGLSTTCLPIFLEVTAALLIDRHKVWQNLTENWVFNVLLLTVFFLLGSLVGSIRFSISKFPPSSAARSTDCNRAQLIELLSGIRYADDLMNDEISMPDSSPCTPVLSLFVAIGLIKPSARGFISVSTAADSLIASLIAHLKDANTNFIGDWSVGTNDPEYRRLIRLIGATEEHRIANSPLPNATPAREIRAGIALIRADFKGVSRFLVIKSFTWNNEGAWTPVMGAEEKNDGTLLNTIKREIQEEMKLRPNDVVDARELTTVNDKRISKRVGLFTLYTYGIFAVQLRQSSSSVQHFFTENPQVSIDFSKSVRIHHFTWLTWDQLISSQHLAAEMPTVLAALRTINPQTIPQTVSI